MRRSIDRYARATTFLLGVVVASAAAFILPAAVVNANFYSACTSGTEAIYQPIIRRDFPAADIIGVIGDSDAHPTSPCTSPSNTKWDMPMVLPANLQSASKAHGIVQLGIWRCTPPPMGCPNGMPNDNAYHFMYICDDMSGGAVCQADKPLTGWTGPPEDGLRYRFKIVWQSDNTWRYTIKELASGVTWSTTIPAHWHDGDTAWWGPESHNTHSGMGYQDNAQGWRENMYWMQYYRQSVGNWQVTTGDVIDHETQPLGLAWPTYWQDQVYDQNYNGDAANWWTTNH